MSEAKHTPGPWAYDDVNQEIYFDDGDVAPRIAVLDTSNCESTYQPDADGRLIAAAPDLLAMLKVAQLWLDVDGRYDMQGINAAIAKAEGCSS